MTKKDYELIAGVFKRQRDGAVSINDTHQADSIDALALALSDKLLNTQERFDSTKFLKACGTY